MKEDCDIFDMIQKMCKFNERHGDTEYHISFAYISDHGSLIFYTQSVTHERWV
jgi:hypothetical protein